MLKGDDTLVVSPGGRVAISRGGAPALATAGTGDVLSGVIGAMLAKGLPPAHAACAGSTRTCARGRSRPAPHGADGVIASDVIHATAGCCWAPELSGGPEGPDLREGHLPRVLALEHHPPIPLRGRVDPVLERPPLAPAERLAGERRVEADAGGLAGPSRCSAAVTSRPPPSAAAKRSTSHSTGRCSHSSGGAKFHAARVLGGAGQVAGRA